jgi:hypothetical protein
MRRPLCCDGLEQLSSLLDADPCLDHHRDVLALTQQQRQIRNQVTGHDDQVGLRTHAHIGNSGPHRSKRQSECALERINQLSSRRSTIAGDAPIWTGRYPAQLAKGLA